MKMLILQYVSAVFIEKCIQLKFAGWLVLVLLQSVSIILSITRYNNICMKNMRMLILHYVYNDL